MLPEAASRSLPTSRYDHMTNFWLKECKKWYVQSPDHIFFFFLAAVGLCWGFPDGSDSKLIAQLVKNPPARQKTLVQFLGWEDPLEKG